jgi:hypothetical protein
MKLKQRPPTYQVTVAFWSSVLVAERRLSCPAREASLMSKCHHFEMSTNDYNARWFALSRSENECSGDRLPRVFTDGAETKSGVQIRDVASQRFALRDTTTKTQMTHATGAHASVDK